MRDLARAFPSFLAVLVAALIALAAPAIASAQTNPPDVVQLRDGTFLRGTIVERSPERVVVMLPTGETRTYAAAEVAAAGPSEAVLPTPVPPPPQVQLIAPMAAARPRIRVSSNQSGLSLHRLTGTATGTVWTGRGVGVVQIDDFAVVCNAPCETEIDPGTYQLGIANGSSGAIRAGTPVEIQQPLDLHLTYDDRSGFRVAGWVTIGVGLGAGTGLILASALDVTSPDFLSGPTFVAGLVLYGVSLAVGFPLVFLNDSANVEVRF